MKYARVILGITPCKARSIMISTLVKKRKTSGHAFEINEVVSYLAQQQIKLKDCGLHFLPEQYCG